MVVSSTVAKVGFEEGKECEKIFGNDLFYCHANWQHFFILPKHVFIS